YADHYQASYVGHSLGDALREPEVEARYVALLDAGEFDYKWDLAKHYARVARLEGKLAAHCRERARQLLDVVLQGRGNEEVRFDCLLHVTVAMNGPEREQRELEVLETLRRIGPEIESEEEFLAAWEPAAELDPKHAPTLLELIDAIGNDYNAFEAFARIAARHPPFQAACIERLVARFERRVPNASVST
ncbi:MAG: hypothetical protein K0R38_5591, partial [Polyangiaceae bacterium]|nr:hypothetical protein [Polyangiaceae bacterium]